MSLGRASSLWDHICPGLCKSSDRSRSAAINGALSDHFHAWYTAGKKHSLTDNRNGRRHLLAVLCLLAGAPVFAQCPQISAQPSTQAGCSGGSATFQAGFTASGSVNYQWQRKAPNGSFTDIPGASGTTSTSPVSLDLSSIGAAPNVDGTEYRLVVTDDANCGDTSTGAALQVHVITGMSPQNSNSRICPGGDQTFTVSTNDNATQYQWLLNGNPLSNSNSASFTVTNANSGDAGAYSVQVTFSATGSPSTCTLTSPVRNLAVTATTATISGPATVCANSSGASYSTDGGNSGYSWTVNGGSVASGGSSNAITVNWGSAGSGSVTVQYLEAPDNCPASATYPVTIIAAPNVTVAHPAEICEGGNATLTASGAGSYSWSPATGLSAATGNTVTASPTSTITYTVTGTNSDGCSSTDQVTVTVGQAPNVNVTASNPGICSGGSTTLTASGASTYSWSPSTGLSATTGSSVSASPTTTTTYTVTGTNSAGCTSTETITVTVNPNPTVSVATPAAICAGGSATLTASGASTYSWSPSTGLSSTSGSSVTANPTTTTTYSVTGTNASGCTDTRTVTVTVNNLPSVTVSPSSAICSGGNKVLTAGGASTYTWSPATGLSVTTGASVTASPATTTAYTVTGADASGCSNTAQVTVTVNTNPTVTASAAPSSICTGSSSTLSAGGAATYSWSPATGLSATSGSPVTANPVGTTTYTVSGTSAAGCTGTAMVTITVIPKPTVTVSPTTTTVCNGVATTLTASGVSTYTWSPATGLSGTSGASVSANPSSATNYTVTGTNAAGCSSTATATVATGTTPVITRDLPLDTVGCQQSPISLVTSATGTPAPTVQWQVSSDGGVTWSNINGATNPIYSFNASPSQDGKRYRAVYTNSCGQVASKAVTLHIGAPINVRTDPVSQIGCSSAGSGPTVTFTSSGNGGNGTMTMSWQYSANGVDWMDIPNTTTTSNIGNFSTSYSPPAGSPTGFYRAKYRNGGCVESFSGSAQYTVQTTPAAPVTAPVYYCEDDIAVPLTSTAGSGNSLLWYTTPTGGTGSATAPTPSTNTEGTTTYYVIQQTSGGCKSPRAAITVTVSDKPPKPRVTTPVTYCQGATTSPLTATANPGYTLLWYTSASGGTGSPTAPTPSSATVGSTTYYVSQIGPERCESSRAAITVTINPIPVVNQPANQTLCAGANSTAVTFSGTPASGVTYGWTNSNTAIGLGASGTGNIASFVTTNTGTTPISATITVTPKVTTNGVTCTGTPKTFTITVNPKTVITTPPANVTVCAGGTATFTVAATGTGPLTYQWFDFGPSGSSSTAVGSGSSTLTLTNVTVTMNGNRYRVTVTGLCGTATYDFAVLTVLANPVLTVNAPAVCANALPATVSATATPAGTYTYAWTVPSGATPPGSVASFTTSVAGAYSVTATNSNGCAGTAAATLQVNPNPTVAVTASLAICAGKSTTLTASGATTYSWSPPTGLSATTASTVTASPAATTTYTVTGTTSGCSGTATTTVTVTPNVTSTQSISVCSGQLPYSWNGQRLGAAGSYQAVLTSAQGCDSTVTLTFTVKQGAHTDTTATACTQYVWHGTTYTTSGNYNFFSTGANGCPDTATLHLTINQGVHT
ncbi:beta strand repeat-containing protein, partial [Flaviaesturariibacter aridisoli]